MTPIVPSPNHETKLSIEDRPGNVNNGRIIFVIRVPNNSNNPKSNNNGKTKPAKKKIATNVVIRSNNMLLPVVSDQINSGPILNRAITPNKKASVLVTNTIGPTSNKSRKKLFAKINCG